ncbi:MULTISPECIES: biotin transporter BioY [Bacillaceae]|jgi:biotin transport system substrate-specific component|uniref:Biotin transporter n=1 Tax=Rossellomorea vietnamensis TaxID=218284 RepID=A0A6I6UUS9_9BACI|nr:MULTISPECIES: biotin transporter BioY [Bacillaceae]OXS56118.1 BioY family transporter [Bacillus sp. DSM 27956]PRX72106.1 biotin transport system substrate-specific component [Bacillus sp. V-88]PFG04995.1 biotin transport system substrate-specific component [Bacillus sp. es.034]QHE62802.1 biotin transporter BioY [Rossellomorea vietnamensis]WGG44892.1 biotin transporter BioY [Rossellomorea sp. DA94]
MNGEKLRMIIHCAIFAAMTGIFAQIEIPLPLVPISGQTLAVGITATILGSRYGALSLICYAALGAVGVPVFAGFSGGAQVLVGPTGGYIFGFIIAAYFTGLILEKTRFTIPMAMIANTVGMIITLILGTIQLKFVADLGWSQAMAAGVYPFIVVGLIKAFLASWIGITVRKRLVQAKLIQNRNVAA